MNATDRFLYDSHLDSYTLILKWKDGTFPSVPELQYLCRLGYISLPVKTATLTALEAYDRRYIPETDAGPFQLHPPTSTTLS